jgi:hypothetical protein
MIWKAVIWNKDSKDARTGGAKRKLREFYDTDRPSTDVGLAKRCGGPRASERFGDGHMTSISSVNCSCVLATVLALITTVRSALGNTIACYLLRASDKNKLPDNMRDLKS